MNPLPRILVIAGSDSGGGAGIQADIKTITMLGGYAMTAITAITAQNTQGVFAVHPVPLPMIEQQIRLVLEDIGADAIKIGMLGTAEITYLVATVLKQYATHIPIILDPVMQAKGGASLLQQEAVSALKDALLPMAYLVTPNIPEAQQLSALDSITDSVTMREAARQIYALGVPHVVMKGGHLAQEQEPVNLLYNGKEDKEIIIHSSRIDTRHTHGTGCTLASALATFIGKGDNPVVALEKATVYVHQAMLHAPGFGKGHGPLNHGWTLKDNSCQKAGQPLKSA